MSRDRRERRERARAGLPPANRIPENIDGRFRAIEQIGVASWCPTPDGSGPAEAVALHFAAAGMGEFALRLKTPAKVDELIAMLERHRNDVWPGAPVAGAAADSPRPDPRPDPQGRTIAEEWRDFAAAIFTTPVSATQRTETRRAFYAGSRAMLTLLQTMSTETGWDTIGDAQGVLYCEQLAAELAAFNEAVKAGDA